MERRAEILSIAQKQGRVGVEPLAAALRVSAHTIRRDLNALCEEGLLRRVHGGAEFIDGLANLPYAARSVLNFDAKQEIARAVAALVPDGATLFISIGTTPALVAHELAGREELTVVTNNLNAAMALAENGTNRIILPGGEMRLPDRDFLNPEAIALFDAYRADFGIYGVGGIDTDGSLLDFHAPEVQARERIRVNSRQSILVADRSKFGRRAAAVGGRLQDSDLVVLDQRPDARFSPASHTHRGPFAADLPDGGRGMSHLRLDNVGRQWNGRGGVRGVSLEVTDGAFVSILGPSGCGKSTLLRLISGLETPETGSVHIAGREVTHLPASQRGLSMVFQSYALFPHLSLRENVLFGMKVRRVPRAERAQRFAEAVSMLGLEGLETRKPAALSGGQRQRVALARAVVSGHPLCLMDEPLSNLDARLRNSVRRDIKALQRRLGLTVIYVTHDQTEAMSLSDQVVLMREGQVEQAGAPQSLYTRPVSTFAAEFIGEPPMAILDGTALGTAGSLVGIRPEHLEIAAEDADLTCTVVDVEYLGAETHLVIDHPAGRGLILSVAGQGDWQPGQPIGLRLPAQDRVLFDAETGRVKKDPQQDYEARTSPNIAHPVTAARHPDSTQ